MNWLRGLTIRTRLTAATVAVAFVISLAAGLLLHANVTATVRATTIQLLRDDAAPIEATILATPTSPKLTAGEGQLVLVVAPDGEVALSNLPDSLSDEKGVLEALSETPSVIRHDTKEFLVIREFVTTSAGTWRIVVARSTEPGDLLIAQLGLTYVIGGILLFVLLGLTSWILSGAALRPVGRMRAEAERLGDATSVGRLPVGPARDELAELAVTLNHLIERNRTSVERERQMISDASHELRTPLAVLIAQLDAASVTPPSPAETSSPSTTDRLEQARQTASRLSRLATNLLQLSSIESRRGTGESSGVMLSAEFAEAVDRARTLADDRGIVVDFDVSDTAPGRFYALEIGSFGRVIDNLLSNAVAASDPGAVVRADFQESSESLVVTIRDSGVGMPEEFIPIAFDRFTRPENARARSSGGSGLGLAIVAGIIDSAHGSISIANTAPGLQVTVTIPSFDEPIE